LFLVHRAIPVVTSINMNRLVISSSIESYQRIQNLRSEATRAAEPASGTRPFTRLHEGIRFNNVSFSYVQEGSVVEALKGVSFEIIRGKMVALVGPSGAGKSTTVDLITRFYDATEGEILVDDVPIGDYDIRSLRQRIAFVTQEPSMFHDTIRANICFGLEDDEKISDERIRDCLRRSHCAEFVDPLPAGVETIIGERGLRLSGGQRQRLALARALVQNPELLILDEPTSALDSVSEAEIHASLEALRGEVTMIVIAHRLATIRSADVILVLDDGHLVAEGTHAALQEKVGTYQQLVEMQQL
ncbi:MAG: ATP-binding cassette domain-containing protein, partial [Rhodothermales bacterium]|nr:ATP-binding cassette domain-containing protein [Rhodothermales bacterium]